ncbi:EF-hand domain-containing protein [Kushneria aurantia]|uniref:EF-hand domain-containing protein n=1 Tax=Kushneria aurantia TaxID=504092 RepID=A0ABV6G5M0_9GAMM|nr:EF-hand domain-containing protein [Kushneria aurantia]
MKTKATLAFGLTLLGGLGGCTQLPFGDGEGSFERGKLENSLPPQVVADFNRIDSDGNGYIDPTEASASADLIGNFGLIDTNSDRQISLQEYANSMEAR